MAKKILAVILAVTIALSAMAISVFAEDYTIPLFKDKSAWQSRTNNELTVTAYFDIPVYGMYGYLTAGDYLMIDLPKDWGGNCATKDGNVYWSVNSVGQWWDLPTIKNIASWDVNANKENLESVKIVLGYMGHHFDGHDTAIPQSVSYNQVSSIRLAAQFTFPNTGDGGDWKVDTGLFGADKPYGKTVKAQWYKADGTAVNGSVSYAYGWNISKTADPAKTNNNTYDFVNEEWADDTRNESNIPFTWDHTLEARDEIMKAVENNYSIELHVPLNKSLNGLATYTLYANTGDSTYATNWNGYWWQYDASRTYVNKYPLDGSTDELVFDVPASTLYDKRYGTFNSEFVIFEDILLLNNTVMKDYRHIDRAKVGGGAGNLGDLSWVGQYEGDPDLARYKGQIINYARSGKAGRGKLTELSREVISIPASSNGNYDHSTSTVLVHKDSTYTISFAGGANLPERYQVGSAWNKIAKEATPATDASFQVTGAELINAGCTEGSTFGVYTNSWGSKESYDACTITVVESGYNGYLLDADVMATNDVRLVIKKPDAGEQVGEEVKTPTDTTTNDADDEGDDANVGDDTPTNTTEEKNPHTGVALAVIPMLVAAAAAVASKKH